MIFGFYGPEYPELCLEIALSLTACGKSDCFAVSMFDERVFPYSPQGGIQLFQRALSHSLVFTLRLLQRYAPLRGAT